MRRGLRVRVGGAWNPLVERDTDRPVGPGRGVAMGDSHPDPDRLPHVDAQRRPCLGLSDEPAPVGGDVVGSAAAAQTAVTVDDHDVRRPFSGTRAGSGELQVVRRWGRHEELGRAEPDRDLGRADLAATRVVLGQSVHHRVGVGRGRSGRRRSAGPESDAGRSHEHDDERSRRDGRAAPPARSDQPAYAAEPVGHGGAGRVGVLGQRRAELVKRNGHLRLLRG